MKEERRVTLAQPITTITQDYMLRNDDLEYECQLITHSAAWAGHHNVIDNLPLWAMQHQSSTANLYTTISYLPDFQFTLYLVHETKTPLEPPGP